MIECYKGNLENINILLEYKPDVNMQFNKGITSLMLAIE